MALTAGFYAGFMPFIHEVGIMNPNSRFLSRSLLPMLAVGLAAIGFWAHSGRPGRAAVAQAVEPAVDPAADFLETEFCSGSLCAGGSWREWIIVEPGAGWTVDELLLVREATTAAVDALDRQGLDGRALLAGYRFRRQAGEFIGGRRGTIAVVDHNVREIILADTAFLRLRGFFILHELGHVVDYNSGRRLSETFHRLAGSDLAAHETAEGFWLNLPAETDLEEAAADAFALWVMGDFQPGYRPVFAFTPVTADYAGIADLLARSLAAISPTFPP